MNFNIKPTENHSLHESAINKINNLTKPKGSLGRLEELALQVCMIQETTEPKLRKPHNILFAADHGIVEEGVSLSPKEITWQQISNFIHGGAGINFLCRQHGFKFVIVDSGVDYDLPKDKGIIDRKINRGTRNFLYGDAMTENEMEKCLEYGAECVTNAYNEGCNIVSFGEMGIGNTSASSLWMTCLTNIPLRACVGSGSGLDKAGIEHKYNILKQALDNFKGENTVRNIMKRFGGYEMVMAVGGMLRAAELRMIILVDGFIMTSCMLAASLIQSEVRDYAIFCHVGDESGHKLLLDYMNAKPLLSLSLRLGEGSGAVCAFPIIDSAVRMINEMDTFSNASITKYF